MERISSEKYFYRRIKKMYNIEALLENEIRDELDELSKMQLGTKEHTDTVNNISKLVDKLNELRKGTLDSQKFDIEIQKASNEEILKDKEIEENKKSRRIRNGIEIAGIVVPAALAVWGTLKSFKFEETGTVVTQMGRGWINKLIPKK
jgi:hypothetical protein